MQKKLENWLRLQRYEDDWQRNRALILHIVLALACIHSHRGSARISLARVCQAGKLGLSPGRNSGDRFAYLSQSWDV